MAFTPARNVGPTSNFFPKSKSLDWKARFGTGGVQSMQDALPLPEPPGGAVGEVSSFSTPTIQAGGTAGMTGFYQSQVAAGIDPLNPIDRSTRDFTKNGSTGAPDKTGGWIEGAKVGVDLAQVGVSAYNAYEQSKMNKFMKEYYSDQMDLQRADFANAARGTNEALSSRRERQLDARGFAADSAQNKKRTAEYMSKWGVNESF